MRIAGQQQDADEDGERERDLGLDRRDHPFARVAVDLGALRLERALECVGLREELGTARFERFRLQAQGRDRPGFPCACGFGRPCRAIERDVRRARGLQLRRVLAGLT